MRNCRRRAPALWFLFWFLMGLELCASLNHEGVALLRFKEMIEADPFHALLDWDEGDSSPCSWFGVECLDDGLVTGLNLANLGLKGMLPPQIGEFTHMHSLILHKNSFYGIIPTEIGDLQELKMLDLGYNNFDGPIPSELRNILSLEFLFLKGNRLSGGLLPELNELTRLCESQVQDWTLSNRASIARSKGNAIIRKLLASKENHSPIKQMLGSETSVLEPLDMSPFFTIPDPRQDPEAPLPPPDIHCHHLLLNLFPPLPLLYIPTKINHNPRGQEQEQEQEYQFFNNICINRGSDLFCGCNLVSCNLHLLLQQED